MRHLRARKKRKAIVLPRRNAPSATQLAYAITCSLHSAQEIGFGTYGQILHLYSTLNGVG